MQLIIKEITLMSKFIEYLFEDGYQNGDTLIVCTDGNFRFHSKYLTFYEYFRTNLSFKESVGEEKCVVFNEYTIEDTKKFVNLEANNDLFEDNNEEEEDLNLDFDVPTMTTINVSDDDF